MTLGILPVSGLGTRLKELGRHYPKCLLPFKDKPLIYAQLDYFIKQDITDVCVVLNHNKEQILETVKRHPNLDKLNITYVEQPVLNGLANAVKLAQDTTDVSDVTDIFIVLGDLIPSSHKLPKNTLGVQEVQDYSRWCMVTNDEGSVQYFDKPSTNPGTNLALCGVYYVPRIDFTGINDVSSKEVELSQFLPQDVNLETVHVQDFGTLNDFLLNKGTRNSRDFNDVVVDKFTVKKTSNDFLKIANEINWFRKRPDDLRLYSATMLFDDMSKGTYTTERVLAPTLRELYLYLDRAPETWSQITCAVKELINKEEFKNTNAPVQFNHEDIFNKTVQRTENIEQSLVIDNFLKDFKHVLDTATTWNGHIHGDLCFSNMFWKDGLIKLIDPKGPVTGSMYYELAKFIHSLDYDFIDAELYSKDKIYDAGTEDVRFRVNKLLNDLGLDEREILTVKYVEASLFLSMIPLHSHSLTNQEHFMRLFEEKYSTLDSLYK